MKTYKVYANGQPSGTIRTDNLESFIRENYKFDSLRYTINEKKNKVLLYFDILEVMKKSIVNE